jgi:hypothetical protein
VLLLTNRLSRDRRSPFTPNVSGPDSDFSLTRICPNTLTPVSMRIVKIRPDLAALDPFLPLAWAKA